MLSSLSNAPVQTASLADYTSARLIVPQLRERDTAGVIQELSQLLHQEALIPDLLPFYNAAMNREYLVSTAMDYGMAFPHARVANVKRLSFALGKVAQPIAWGPKGSVTVDVIFLMAVPATDATSYLQVLAAVAKLSKDATKMNQLRHAQSATEMFDLLRQCVMPGAKPPGI